MLTYDIVAFIQVNTTGDYEMTDETNTSSSELNQFYFAALKASPTAPPKSEIAYQGWLNNIEEVAIDLFFANREFMKRAENIALAKPLPATIKSVVVEKNSNRAIIEFHTHIGEHAENPDHFETVRTGFLNTASGKKMKDLAELFIGKRVIIGKRTIVQAKNTSRKVSLCEYILLDDVYEDDNDVKTPVKTVTASAKKPKVIKEVAEKEYVDDDSAEDYTEDEEGVEEYVEPEDDFADDSAEEDVLDLTTIVPRTPQEVKDLASTHFGLSAASVHEIAAEILGKGVKPTPVQIVQVWQEIIQRQG